MRLSSTLLFALVLACPAAQSAQFTYHGDLLDGDTPAEGAYDLRVRSFANPDASKALGEATELPAVKLVGGRFSVELDLPDDPDGTSWVAVEVRRTGSGDAFEQLGAPQPVSKANSTCPGAWALDGNTGLPAGSFLGIADAASATPLVLKIADDAVATFTPRNGTPEGSAPSVALGSLANVASGVGATVGGGGASQQYTQDCPTCANRATGPFATIAGGYGHLASGTHGFVGGGYRNTASGWYSVVVGGSNSGASGNSAVIGGGAYNSAGGDYAVAGGGAGSRASGDYSTVVGGASNIATGDFSAIGGGTDNCAGGDGSWAGGTHAKARPATGEIYLGKGGPAVDACFGIETGDTDGDRGTFVWADGQPGDFVSTGDDQFLVRASGGMMLNTTELISTQADDLLVAPRAAPADPDADIALRSRSGSTARIFLSDGDGSLRMFASEAGDTRFILGGGSAGAGKYLVTGANGAYLTTGGAWTNGSSRAFKQAFEAIDAGDVLARVLQLPLSRWRYRNSDEGVHLGPMAEDFADAFGLGGSAQHISTVDADGVALAAIQGLNAKLEQENASLRATLDGVLARLEQLEAAAAQ